MGYVIYLNTIVPRFWKRYAVCLYCSTEVGMSINPNTTNLHGTLAAHQCRILQQVHAHTQSISLFTLLVSTSTPFEMEDLPSIRYRRPAPFSRMMALASPASYCRPNESSKGSKAESLECLILGKAVTSATYSPAAMT
jgi:hypothetical protein